MHLSLEKRDLATYVVRQLNQFFPDPHEVQFNDLQSYFDLALERTEFCFSKVNNKYFFDGQYSVFDHLHGDQYAMFLYFLANSIYRKEGDLKICKKLFLLNKTLHGLDAFYEVTLPDIFLCVHPLGTVLGRGQYQNYLLVYQRCGVGSNRGIYPQLKEYVTLRPGASVLGKCLVEENCTIAAGALLLDRSLEKNTVYIGNPRGFTLKTIAEHVKIWKT